MSEYTLNDYNNLKALIEQYIGDMKWELNAPNIEIEMLSYKDNFMKILKLLEGLFKQNYWIKKIWFDNDAKFKIEIDDTKLSDGNKNSIGGGSDRTRAGIHEEVINLINNCIDKEKFIEAIELLDLYNEEFNSDKDYEKWQHQRDIEDDITFNAYSGPQDAITVQERWEDFSVQNLNDIPQEKIDMIFKFFKPFVNSSMN